MPFKPSKYAILLFAWLAKYAIFGQKSYNIVVSYKIVVFLNFAKQLYVIELTI